MSSEIRPEVASTDPQLLAARRARIEAEKQVKIAQWKLTSMLTAAERTKRIGNNPFLSHRDLDAGTDLVMAARHRLDHFKRQHAMAKLTEEREAARVAKEQSKLDHNLRVELKGKNQVRYRGEWYRISRTNIKSVQILLPNGRTQLIKASEVEDARKVIFG